MNIYSYHNIGVRSNLSLYHLCIYTTISSWGIREIPDHATFRETVQTLTWLDKLRGVLSLALCN